MKVTGHQSATEGPGRVVAMGTSNDESLLLPYGVTEAQIAMAALDGIHYAADKAGGHRERFVVELVGEFEVAVREAMGLDDCDG